MVLHVFLAVGQIALLIAVFSGDDKFKQGGATEVIAVKLTHEVIQRWILAHHNCGVEEKE